MHTCFRLPRMRDFADGDSGAVTIFAIIAFSMLVVVVGLVIDVGRVMNVHSQASSYADRVALAAAAELDGRPSAPGVPGALTRAVNAAQGANSQVDPGFRITLSGDNTIGVRKLTFLSALGPDPADPYARSPVAGDTVTATWAPGVGFTFAGGMNMDLANRETNFVLVDTTRETEDYLFFPLLAAVTPGIETSATVAPQALAGFQRQVCNSPPIMMCNIAEATQGPGAPFTYDKRQMIRAKIRTGSGSLVPGDLKVLEMPNGMGAADLRNYMGRIEPNTFCAASKVNVRIGPSITAIRQGLNTRFDMFEGPMHSVRNSSTFTPAPNVLKGLSTNGGSCHNSQSDDSTPLPRDNCFMPARGPGETIRDGVSASVAGTGCLNYGGRAIAGNGSWARSDYWNYNQDSDHPKPPNSVFNTISRYDLYRWEISHDLAHRDDEVGWPTCSNRTPTEDPLRDRRVLPVAVVNCMSNPTDGNRNDVPIEAYAEIFLTEPAGDNTWWNGQTDDLFFEIVGEVRPNLPGSVLREFPVLYR